jgi:hypothetical protein
MRRGTDADDRLGQKAALFGVHLTVPALLPLLWIAGRIAPTMYDEFTHWLPNARFLIGQDAFPDASHHTFGARRRAICQHSR